MSTPAPQPNTAILSNSTYNTLKGAVTIVLPALGTLYFALAQIWGLPYAGEVTGSVAAVNTFLGVVLGLSSKSYNNSDDKYFGTINLHETDSKKTYSLDANGDPEDLDKMNEALFKVNKQE